MNAVASGWAALKTAASAISAPVTLPALGAAALCTTRLTARRIEDFPDHLRAIAAGERSPLPAQRTRRIDASQRYLITSDLHRCIPGQIDWPARQGVKGLYATVLAAYGDDGWHLVENGDIEDFWMVGGSAAGARYDVEKLAAGITGSFSPNLRRRVMAAHLDRIVANNAEIYATIRDGFAADGRYHRTMGNHDDVFSDPHLVEHLARHLPGVEVVDTLLLHRDDDVEGVIAHGHLTDSWNGPGFAALGRAMTWLGTTLDDAPLIPSFEGLPEASAVERLLGAGIPNRLLAVDPYYGGNRRFDTLDEQRLFAALDDAGGLGGAADAESEWPWLIFGHTHFPMLRPLDVSGRPAKYANSGCGILPNAFTALEWDGSRPEDPLRLVVWVDRGEPTRFELVPDGDAIRVAQLPV